MLSVTLIFEVIAMAKMMQNCPGLAEKQSASWWRMIEKLRRLDGCSFDLHSDLTPEDVRKARGSAALANEFAEYLAVSKQKTKAALAPYARYEIWHGAPDSPVVVLNEPTFALLTKIVPELGQDWVGVYLSNTQRARMVVSIGRVSKSCRDATTRELLSRLAWDLDSLSEESDLVLVRQLAPVRDVIAHEQTHAWQKRWAYDSKIARRVAKSRLYGRAACTLAERGYLDGLIDERGQLLDPRSADAVGLLLWDEIGAHMAEGDDLGLGNGTNLRSLSFRYFEAYPSMRCGLYLRIPLPFARL